MFTQGFVKLSRKIMSWQWYSDMAVYKLFTHLMLSANIRDCDWRGVRLKRGDAVSSLSRLSAETGMTVSQVRTALGKLESTGDIIVTKHGQFTVYSVAEYDSFQEEAWDDEDMSAGKRQSANNADKPSHDLIGCDLTEDPQEDINASAYPSQDGSSHTIYKNYNKYKKYDKKKNAFGNRTHNSISKNESSFDIDKILEHAIYSTPSP